MIARSFCVFLLFAELAFGKQEMKMVHVLFVHPTEYSIPTYLQLAASDSTGNIVREKDPTISWSGLDIMTKEEKLAIYNLGVRLRERYNNLLGDIYNPRISRTRTTDADVSMMSGNLVDAGLWPPLKEQEWLKGFNWQPVPTEYVSRNVDTLLMGRLCPTFEKTTNAIRNSADFLRIEKKHHRLFSMVSRETGLAITNSRDISYLYKSLKARASRNLTLPSWTNGIFPEGEMLKVVYLEDDLLSKTNIQQKLNGGYLLQKIFLDSATSTNNFLDSGRKIEIYSGDSDLFNGVLHALDVWYPQFPNTASALIFELLYDPEYQTYEMKIFHDLGEDDVTIPLEIPSCSRIKNSTGCRFENLIISLTDILPGDDPTLCGHSVTEISFREEVAVEMTINNAPSISIDEVIVIFCFTMLTFVL